MDIQIDLSWENSFRLADGRRDAAWVFVKYMVPTKDGGDGLWHHSWLNNTGHSLSNASGAYSLGLQSTKAVYNQSTNPALGAFVYQANPTAGAPFSQKLSLNWNYGTNKRDGVNLLSAKDSIHVRVFAVEMVYVPSGEFYLGSGGSETGGFVDAATKPAPYKVLSEQAIKIQATEGLWTNDGTLIASGILPDLFPKGYGSFYCMKNEISQKQIVDFLNTLSPSQASFHYNGATVNRNSISYNGTDYVASAKELPCTTLTWVTLAAYLDWSGLRPMTELEFEKICRGPLVPVSNEYAWGSNAISAKSGIVGAGTSSETSASGNCTYNSSGPYRVGSSATSANNRVQAGASYYGAFDMSGNVRESVISIAQPAGWQFTGEHGNGELNNNAADVTSWPVLEGASISGTGWKGGSFHDTSTDPLRISDRSQVNNNNTLGDFGPGGRGVRSQPSILVKTDSVRGLTDASATAYGYVVQSGDETSYVSGMCWSPLTSPSLLDPYTTDGRTSGIGTYNSTLTGLSPCTSYNVRAYANGTSSGVVYGNVLTLITPQTPVTAALGDDNICEGATTTLSLKDYNFGNIQWSVSTDGTSWNSVGATGRNTSLTTPPLTPPKTYFRADISGMPCAPISSNVVAVNVTPTVGVPIFTQKIESLCQNSDDATYAATATNSTGIKFSASPVTVGEINESSGVINWDDDFYGNATIIATAQGCNGPKITNLSVAVSQSSNAGTISVGQSQICMGDQPTLTTTGSVGSLQWQVSDDKVLWVDISGATGTQYTVPTPLTKKQYYRVRATNSPCASVYSSVQTLTPLYRWFRNTTTATGVAASVQNGLANTKALLKLASPTGYGIDVDVSFPSSINSYTDINVPIGAVEYCMRMNYDNSGNLKSGITKNNMWYLPAQAELMHMEVARKCQGSFDGDYYWSSTENNASSAWFVDFGWLEGTTSTITKTNCSQVRCLQRNINIHVTTKVVSSITQTTGNSGGDITSDTPIISTGICWNLTGQPSVENHIGIIYNGAVSNSFTDFLSGLTPCKTYYVRAFAVDSWGGVSYGNERSFTTDKDIVASITGSSVICAGETTVLTAANAASYLWSTGETTQSITVGTAGTYSVTETSSKGCVDNTSFVLTVNPLGQVNQPSNLTFCAGASVNTIVFSTNNFTGTTTYSWTNSNTSIGLGASGTGNIGAFTSSNSGSSPITATITVTPTYTNNGLSCTGPSKIFTITVNPQAQVDQPFSQTVCKGSYVSSIDFTTANSVGSTTYSWTNSNTSIGLAASGTGNISGFTATNAGTTPITSTITVTPTFSYNGASCSGSAKTFTITVNPVGQVNQPSSQTVCAGSSTTAINFATVNTGGTTSYSWTNNNTSIGLAASGTGNISGFTATNAGTTPITSTITVTPTFTYNGVSCSGSARTFTITVNPKPVITNKTRSVCEQSFWISPTTGTDSDLVPAGTTYSWPVPTVVPSVTGVSGLASGTDENDITGSILNTNTYDVTVTYTVTPKAANGCLGNPFTVAVTVKAKNTVSVGSCSPLVTVGTAMTSITHTTTGATGISNSGVSGANGLPLGVSATWSFGTQTITISGTPTTAGSFTYSIPLTGGCGTVSATGVITVNCATITTQVVDVISPTGKVWMDRNLGASRQALSSNDELAFGYIFQWGRNKDGHECRYSATTITRSADDTPDDGNFIITTGTNDWRTTPNNTLWQGASGTNNPCPTGYRIPTSAELDAERAIWTSQDSAGAFASALKLPFAKWRYNVTGAISEGGHYWSSTVLGDSDAYTLYFPSTGSNAAVWGANRASGFSVRCIKNLPISSLDCNGAIVTGTLIAGQSASGVSADIPYTGGNGSSHTGQTVNSTGVTGLTATLEAGSFASGNGTVRYVISGTPSSSGTASFAINIGGVTCNLTCIVVPVDPPFKWFTNTDTFTNVASSTTDGLANTKALLGWPGAGYNITFANNALPPNINGYSGIATPVGAVEYCMRMNYEANGTLKAGINATNMWYLPAAEEMNLLLIMHRCESLTGDFYWSSTEQDTNSYVWWPTMSVGCGSASKSTDTNKVRCVRR